MTKEELERVKKLAEEHWEFLEPRYKMMFMDGWLHATKHALKEKKDEGK